jgi:predicted phage terminase large subunit-like protein
VQALKRRSCRSSLLAFSTEVLRPYGQKPASHHRLIVSELERVARGETLRLILMLPPGSAKSTYASVIFPAWFHAQAPNLDVIGASHTATLADTFSKRVQHVVREHSELLGYGLATEAVERWTTTEGGTYRAVGVGGPVTGTRASLAVVDDPVKSRAEAESKTIRDKVWNWYSADLLTRLKPGGRIVLIMTRWHPDDLAGRVLTLQPEAWRMVCVPALATAHDDPLGRAIGDPLWADDAYGYAADLLAKRDEYERSGSARDWASLYQQTPRAMEGNLFKTAQIRVLDAAPAGGSMVRRWDLAATAAIGTRDPDWTVGVKMAHYQDGSFCVLDVVRFRGGPDEVERTILNIASHDGKGIRIVLPEDPGQAGKAQCLYLTRKLVGHTVESIRETGDKATRAMPFASQVNVGNVSIVKAPWNAAFLEELASFPDGSHDDQTDAAAGAFSRLYRPPMKIAPEALQRLARPMGGYAPGLRVN